MTTCGCIRCHTERHRVEFESEHGTEELLIAPLCAVLPSMTFDFRYACELCGNKRCPHHTDHRLACTNSNEPGQKGSVYE